MVLLLMAGGFYYSSITKTSEVQVPLTKKVNVEKKPANQKIITESTKSNTATLEINGVEYKTEITEKTSVYDFMDKLRIEGKIAFKDKTFIGIGKFIEEIAGIRGDGDRYWIYYVNGKKATIGVSNYEINSGDVVSWKYEKEVY